MISIDRYLLNIPSAFCIRHLEIIHLRITGAVRTGNIWIEFPDFVLSSWFLQQSDCRLTTGNNRFPHGFYIVKLLYLMDHFIHEIKI